MANTFTNILNKISSLLPNSITTDENVIDITKTFSSDSINVNSIIRKILGLDIDFPNHILNSKSGHKYNELGKFQEL